MITKSMEPGAYKVATSSQASVESSQPSLSHITRDIRHRPRHFSDVFKPISAWWRVLESLERVLQCLRTSRSPSCRLITEFWSLPSAKSPGASCFEASGPPATPFLGQHSRHPGASVSSGYLPIDRAQTMAVSGQALSAGTAVGIDPPRSLEPSLHQNEETHSSTSDPTSSEGNRGGGGSIDTASQPTSTAPASGRSKTTHSRAVAGSSTPQPDPVPASGDYEPYTFDQISDALQTMLGLDDGWSLVDSENGISGQMIPDWRPDGASGSDSDVKLGIIDVRRKDLPALLAAAPADSRLHNLPRGKRSVTLSVGIWKKGFTRSSTHSDVVKAVARRCLLLASADDFDESEDELNKLSFTNPFATAKRYWNHSERKPASIKLFAPKRGDTRRFVFLFCDPTTTHSARNKLENKAFHARPLV